MTATQKDRSLHVILVGQSDQQPNSRPVSPCPQQPHVVRRRPSCDRRRPWGGSHASVVPLEAQRARRTGTLPSGWEAGSPCTCGEAAKECRQKAADPDPKESWMSRQSNAGLAHSSGKRDRHVPSQGRALVRARARKASELKKADSFSIRYLADLTGSAGPAPALRGRVGPIGRPAYGSRRTFNESTVRGGTRFAGPTAL